MSKYIIVDKDSAGNQYGKQYTVTYQLVGNPTRYKIDLYCYSESDEGFKYCYIEGHLGYGIETMQDKDEFLKEFYKFQKGGSYRKTHPIQYSDEEIIQKKINDKEDEISVLKRELNNIKRKKQEDKFDSYYDNVDRKSLDTYISKLKNILSNDDRYYVHSMVMHIWEGYRFYIYDKVLQKDIKIGICDKDKNFKFRDLNIDDM